MRKVLMLPTPQQAMADLTNSIHAIVVHLRDHLPQWGYELTENRAEADLIVGHAGQQYSQTQADVAHIHGLYPTAYANLIEPWHHAANQGVIQNLMAARIVSCPSDWVAQILRRDLHISPRIVPWAIDPDDWTVGDNQGYILWNKTRADGTCDPTPLLELARKASQFNYLSTFGDNPPSNVRIIGRRPFAEMKKIIQGAGVYLATTRETFGIGTLEAMACGIPILGYRHGNNAALVQHGINGYLVEPGDIEGLVGGLQYCLQNREILGQNGRFMASLFTWEKVAQVIAGIYDELFENPVLPKVAVVIPFHNYSRFVDDTLASVFAQDTNFERQVIVVDDGSTPEEKSKLADILTKYPDVLHIVQQGQGVASARNAGINATNAEYIVCIDSDDKLNDPHFLQVLADELDKDRGLGIVFTGLKVMNEQGEPSANNNPWPSGYDWEAQVAGRNQVPTCCMFRREAWRRAGGYKAYYTPAEDAELWLRIGAIGYRAKQVSDAPWFLYRLHSNSLSSEIRAGKRTEPDWRGDKPWINDKQYPLAANGMERPVRHYDRPKVSVIVPVAPYHIPYLGQALDSVERQTERYWELIVVNDTGSELPGLAPYPFAKVISTEGQKGAGYARNLGVKHAIAPLVTFLDADDMFLPTFLEKTIRKYQQTGRYIYSDWMSINKQGQMEEHQTPEFTPGDTFQQPTRHSVNVLLKREWFYQAGGFDESMTSWEDVDFFMRLAQAGICGARVNEPLFIYRYQTGQRREKGETIKGELISLLNNRYNEYITGVKVCGCNNPQPGKQMAIAQGNSSKPLDQQLVRIIYQGPPGQHTVGIGKHAYGYRKGGDSFYVYATDAMAHPELFTPIAEVFEEKQETPTPPPPKPIMDEWAVAGVGNAAD